MKFRHSDFVENVKDHIVIWSGGCDSTLLLYNLAKTYAHNPDIKVTAMAINHYLIATEEKRIAEAEHRKRFIEAMKRRGLNIDCFEISITGNKWFEPGKDGLPQASIWAGLITPYVPKDAALYFGYIRGDDIWHYITELENIIKNHMIVFGKDFKLCMPYEYMKKEEIISNLYREGLLEYTWYCETPSDTSTPCGSCSSCETHKKALLTISEIWKLDWAKNILELDKNKKKEIESIVPSSKNLVTLDPEITYGGCGHVSSHQNIHNQSFSHAEGIMSPNFEDDRGSCKYCSLLDPKNIIPRGTIEMERCGDGFIEKTGKIDYTQHHRPEGTITTRGV